MDYEKKYKEALERAKQFSEKPYLEDSKGIVEYIFPELQESEDERIRKSLIDMLKNDEKCYLKEIAWLEKQGEQKPANTSCLLSWTENEEKMLQSLEGIVKDYWAKAEQENNEIQIKEASDVSYFLKTIKKSPLCWIKCSNELPNKDGIYLVVTDGRHNDVYDIARYDSIEGWHKASEIIYWMPIPQLNNKSIIEQKPAEWSEAEEVKLQNTIDYIEELIRLTKINPDIDDDNIKYYQDSITWLKSLRLHNWKPSDEQLYTLEKATHIVGSKYKSCLTSLYEDLKKLKGE